MHLLPKCLFLLILVKYSKSSAGDSSPFYQKCLEQCNLLKCTDDGKNFKKSYRQSVILYYTKWSCEDECKYDCMWKTVDAFHERNWKTPQFYGKWPFIRILGMQEPASVVFSLLNGYIHYRMIKKFRQEVRPNGPFTRLWHAFFLVSIHAWFWSAVFHTRDFLITELLDYASAFSMILMNCYVMVMRLLRDKVPKFALVTITTFFMAFFVNHALYLSMGQIDYGYNMELNILVGTITAICWFGWCIYNKKHQPYVWKCAMYVAFSGIMLLLEIIDRPPLFYTFDCHSLWHLSTVPLAILIYSFAIDDCRYLRKLGDTEETTDVKKHP